MSPRSTVTYWDASAVLSALFQDSHSDVALDWLRMPGIHLLPSLSWAEVRAVISRIRREGVLTDLLVASAIETLETGPWCLTSVSPGWDVVKRLASEWPLRGADLWHLAAAKSLQEQLPELILLTFDSRLHDAADGEGLSATAPPA